jgi:hypothetical protein
MIERDPIMPERLRRIGGNSFGFIPHRFLREGFLATLTSEQLALYLFLVLAADRNGISFYAYDRICSVLELRLDDYIAARNALIDKDLIAFDGTRFQVLSLPSKPVQPHSKPLLTEANRQEHDPATVRQLVLDSLGIDESDQ